MALPGPVIMKPPDQVGTKSSKFSTCHADEERGKVGLAPP
jgi:hypothetical protein